MSIYKKLLKLLTPALIVYFMVLGRVFAGGEDVGTVPDKINVDSMSGFTLFLVSLYNDHRVVYAITVTALMALIGISIAFLADLILKSLGLQVSKITHHE